MRELTMKGHKDSHRMYPKALGTWFRLPFCFMSFEHLVTLIAVRGINSPLWMKWAPTGVHKTENAKSLSSCSCLSFMGMIVSMVMLHQTGN